MVKNIRRKLRNFTIADVIIYSVLALLTLTMIIPFMNIIAISLSDYSSVVQNKSMLIPKNIHFSAYSIIFNEEVYRSLILSAVIVVVGTALHIFVCLMAAYPLSKKYLPGRKFMLLFILITMLFSGGLIPYYFVIKALNLTNNLLVYILPGAAGAYTIVMMKNFLLQIPVSLEEAALMDGANYFYIMFRIIMPLSKPIIATLALFYGVGRWNDWFTAVLFIRDKKLYTIQNVLRDMVIESNMGAFGNVDLQQSYSTSVKMAAIVIATVPIMLVYPFLQKYFVKGIFLGSVKE